MKKKIALVFGITGQDGSYLAELLLNKNYVVYGVKRRTSLIHTTRIDHIYKDFHLETNFILKYGDVTDFSNVFRLISEINPDEIYNLAAQSHVAVSFEEPEYTANSDAIGALRILEAIRILKLEKKTRYYQASTSELYGLTKETLQNENTPFYPRSPYGVAKLYAYWITINYREAYNMFACNGILFNHESPYRGETFVTRKITKALTKIFLGSNEVLSLGNMDSKRDWGHAKDYVEMQWLMLQNDVPKDYVIATGVQYSVRDFVSMAAERLDMKISWEGEGVNEKGYDQNNRLIVNVSPEYFRPTEVDTLLGDSTLAKKELNWEPQTSIEKMLDEMIEHDLQLAKYELELGITSVKVHRKNS